MAGVAGSMMEKGYIPLVAGDHVGIGWQGSYLDDFWMWNRRFIEYEGGVRHIRTVRVSELKEAALHYWRDGWVPIRPVTEDLLGRMEAALRAHRGLKTEGVTLPDGPFLEMPEEIPTEHFGPEVREYLGLSAVESTGLVRKSAASEEALDGLRRERGS